MLELVHDNRSGTRLEIVVPTLNERHRLRNLVRCYGDRFDIVLLDGGSTDCTIADAIAAGATVFRRTVGGAGLEGQFANYANAVTKSGCSLWMMADEFMARQDLIAIERLLLLEASTVICRRVNWFYCRRMHTYVSQSPRGACRGGIAYDPRDLHDSLIAVPLPGRPVAAPVFDINHLHVYSAKNYFGTAGSYAYEEVEQMRRRPLSVLRFLRRYVVTTWAYVLLKWWREKEATPAVLFAGLGQSIVIFWLATLAWTEQAHLLTAEEQQAQYDRLFWHLDSSIPESSSLENGLEAVPPLEDRAEIGHRH